MSLLDYSSIENEVMVKVLGIRADYYGIADKNPYGIDDAQRASLFDFRVKEHENYIFTVNKVEEYLYEIIEKVILSLFKHTGGTVSVDVVGPDGKDRILIMTFFEKLKVAPLFVIVKMEEGEPVLYCFKNFGINNQIDVDVMTGVLRRIGVKKYHYVSMVENYAYMEVFNHNDSENDPYRGTNVVSFKYFFEKNFGEKEYTDFRVFAHRLTRKIKNCLGWEVVKTLTPNALFSFKKITENSILEYDYKIALSGKISNEKIELLMRRYIEEKRYKAVLSEGDYSHVKNFNCGQFSESFLTSEWLYNSLLDAGRVDYTSISMGYMKAIEELLYCFIASHTGEGRRIDTYKRPTGWEDIPKHEWKWQVDLSDNNIVDKKGFIMLAGMIYFLQENEELFIDTDLVDCLCDVLDESKQIRNGFFHKDNLSDIVTVNEARKSAYLIFLLLLGNVKMTERTAHFLGLVDNGEPYNLLCEYLHCHCYKSYYYGNSIEELNTSIGLTSELTFDANGRAQCTEISFNTLEDFKACESVIRLDEVKSIKRKEVVFTKDSMPEIIFEGDFKPCPEGMRITGPKRMIWKNGRYLI